MKKMMRNRISLIDLLDVRYNDGIERGFDKGLEKGREESREEIARNALMNGLSIDLIHTITGLDADTIKYLGTSAN